MNEERIAAPVSTPWLPIETAPKDGKAILLGARGGCWVGKWLAVYTSGYRPDNPWSSLMLNHDHMGEKWHRPTHWMPLPAAPVSVQAEQPDTQGTDTLGNQAASDAAGPSAYENQTLRAQSTVTDAMIDAAGSILWPNLWMWRNDHQRPTVRAMLDAALAAQEKPQ